MIQESNDYLAHHGILGQKWGVRRYQNYDGSLTAEGRKRRGYSSEGKKAVNAAKEAVRNQVKKRAAAKAQKQKDLEKAKAKARKEEAARKARKAVDDEEKLKRHLREHPADIYKNRDRLSREDLEEIMKQVEWDRKCKDIRRDEYRRGLQKVKDFHDGMKIAKDLFDTNIALYNNMALVYNTIYDSQVANGRDMTGIKKMPQAAWAKTDKNDKDKE